MTRFTLALSALLVTLFLVFPSPAHAQVETGSIRGSVTDPSGAVVRDATVRLIDPERGRQTEVATGNGGFYNLATVRPGHFRMEVEKSGFKMVRLTGITVNVLDNLEQNFRLEVGKASESITVEANAVNVNTTDGTVSTVVDRHFADNLPLNGRNFQTLILLTPGVVVSSTAADDQGQFSVNGQRADANYFTVDGVSANFGVTGFPPLMQSAGGGLPALSALGGTNSLVSMDAMQEFRVQTSSFAPEFGRTPGGQISVVTRSGTNAFHGTLFDYFRNSVLDANDWFSNFNHLPKPDERQNDFGGVVGGPIIKDKTFFFFSYEGLRLRQPATQESVVPDAASRQLQTPAGTSIRPYLSAFPVANGTELGSGLAQFNAAFSDPSSLDAYSIRLDHLVNSKLTLFGRYNYSPSSAVQRGPTASSLSTTESLSSSVHTITLGLTQLLRAHTSNEIRMNYSNHRVSSTYALDHFGGATPLPDSVLFPPGFSSANSFFAFLIMGVGDLRQGKFAIDEQRQMNFIDNLAVTKGSHQLKFGIDYRWLAPFSSPFSYDESGIFSGMSDSPGGALSGIASAGVVLTLQSNALLARNFSLYGQDTWKITRRLTATYGFRWDVNTPLKGKNSANDPYTVTGLDDPATITLAPHGTPLYATRYGNLAPRLGVAYQLRDVPDWGSVLRGGVGIFYDLGYGSLGGVSSYFPYQAVRFLPLAPFPLSPQDAAPPPFTVQPPVPTILVADPRLKLPKTSQWNVAIEQALGKSQTFSVTYVGAIGRDLLRVSNLINPNDDFGLVALTGNTATSDYHALQVKFERRLSGSLQALGSYTFSHSIDSASTDTFAENVNSPGIPDDPNTDRGNSNFDVRHSFTAGVACNLPSPRSNRGARATFGGWSVDSFVFARSAPPVDLVGAVVPFSSVELLLRPNVNPGVPLVLYGSGYPGGKIFNRAAFTPPPSGQQGNFGRNVLRGFGASQADIAIQRQFLFTERLRLNFRSEFFNIFNHPNFGRPIGDLTSPQFGYSTQTLASSLGSGGANGGFNPLYQIGGPRSIQLALKLQF